MWNAEQADDPGELSFPHSAFHIPQCVGGYDPFE